MKEKVQILGDKDERNPGQVAGPVLCGSLEAGVSDPSQAREV